MRTVPLLVVMVVLAASIIVALPVSASPRAASNLQQQPVPTPTPVPTFVPVTGTHTVQQGEWLYCIGRAYQVQPMAIAQASGIPGPYGPYNPYGYYRPTPYYGSYPYYNPYMYYFPYYSPWNHLSPGQHLTIPFNASTAWYNIPPAPVGPACTAQFALPAGWPPPQSTPASYPMPYLAPY